MLDFAIVGAARSGTSFIAAQLSAHPHIDAGSIKEPNFFSRNYERGFEWYDSLFQPRRPGLLRMDASVSYTYPQYSEALSRVADAAQKPYVIYLVRDPIPRAVSHYLFYRHYFRRESAHSFGATLQTNGLYVGASDYRRWIDQLYATFPREQVLIVPFQAVTAAEDTVTSQICAALGLRPPEVEPSASAHRNNVVTFRHPALRLASRTLRRSSLYPAVREHIGAGRLRRLRALVTKDAVLPTTSEVLSSCTPDQKERLRELQVRSHIAVTSALDDQDARLNLDWARLWTMSDAMPPTGSAR